MPTMRGMGPACCCCKDIWPSLAGFQMRLGKPATFPWSAGIGGGNGDYDHVNRKSLYASLSGANYSVYIHDERDLTNTLALVRTVSTTEMSQRWLGCLDPDNQRIIDVSNQPIDAFNDEIAAHVYNYDGTGDTALFTLPLADSPDYNFTISHLHYNRVTETVFAWLYRGTSSIPYAGGSQPHFEIIEFDLLGGAPSVIHSFPVNRGPVSTGSFYQGNVFVIEIDYTNQKLWWERQEVQSDLADPMVIVRKVERSDWDGSNLETILSETTPFSYSHLGWQYSHKDDCFYLSTNNASLSQAADTGNGFWRVEPDWSSKELLFSRSDMIATPSYFRLGCGYETLGAGSPA